MQIVAKVCGVTVQQMQGVGQKQDVSQSRFIAAMMLHEEGLTMKEIHAQFPEHDRTTINTRLTQFDNLIRYDKPFKRLYLDCIELLMLVSGDGVFDTEIFEQ